MSSLWNQSTTKKPHIKSVIQLGHLQQAGCVFIVSAGILVLALGVFFNAMVLVVKKRATSRFLVGDAYRVILAIVDTLTLVTGLPRHILFGSSLVDPVDWSLTSCAVFMSLMYAFQFISSWVMVAAIVEKGYPIFYTGMEQRPWKAAVKVSLVIVFIFLLIQLFWPVVLTIQKNRDDENRCAIHKRVPPVFEKLFGWLVITTNCIIPSVVFVTVQVIMINVLWTHGRRLSEVANTNELVDTSSSTEPAANAVPQRRMTAFTYVSTGSVGTTLKYFFIVELCFLLLFVPRDAFIVYAMMTGIRFGGMRELDLRIPFGVLSVCAYLNNALGFAYYYAFSKKFRTQVKFAFKPSKSPAGDEGLIVIEEGREKPERTKGLFGYQPRTDTSGDLWKAELLAFESLDKSGEKPQRPRKPKRKKKHKKGKERNETTKKQSRADEEKKGDGEENDGDKEEKKKKKTEKMKRGKEEEEETVEKERVEKWRNERWETEKEERQESKWEKKAEKAVAKEEEKEEEEEILEDFDSDYDYEYEYETDDDDFEEYENIESEG